MHMLWDIFILLAMSAGISVLIVGALSGFFPPELTQTPENTVTEQTHASDCALHNEPAFPAGPCDCGVAGVPPAKDAPIAVGAAVGESPTTDKTPT